MKKAITREHNVTGVRIAGWLSESCDDGPGVRSVLFFQGCGKKCPGCHNPQTHDPNGGEWYEVTKLIEIIEDKCPQHLITISGGEPLEQLEGLVVLLMELKEKRYNVCLYTGWSAAEVPDRVLDLIDFLKTGSFIQKLSKEDIQYVGSSNQKFSKVLNGKIQEENPEWLAKGG